MTGRTDGGAGDGDSADGDPAGSVVVFLRAGADVLLVGHADAAGRRDALAAPAGDDPDAAARAAVRAATGPDAGVDLVRRGVTIPAAAAARDDGPVRPYLFELDPGDRAAVDVAGGEWVRPPAIRDRATVPGLWTAWSRVAPAVASVRDDRDHGAAYLSVRALEVLCDRAATLADRLDGEAGWRPLVTLAEELLAARPGMPVVANRVHRAMGGSDARTAAAVRESAAAAIDAATRADEAAALAAADRLRALSDRPTVLTLSRSGTVRRALAAADPGAVLVAASRPGGEGVDVAERLADRTAVTLFSDAAVGHVLGTRAVDAVLVGADAVHPDGTVVNKVGTRTAAAAAAREGVPVYVACARDKVQPDPPADGPAPAPRAPAELYDGDADLAVEHPTFDATPPALVTGVATEAGVLDPGGDEVAAAAEKLRALRGWRE